MHHRFTRKFRLETRGMIAEMLRAAQNWDSCQSRMIRLHPDSPVARQRLRDKRLTSLTQRQPSVPCPVPYVHYRRQANHVATNVPCNLQMRSSGEWPWQKKCGRTQGLSRRSSPRQPGGHSSPVDIQNRTRWSYKARLCAQGQTQVDYTETFASVFRFESLQTAVASAALSSTSPMLRRFFCMPPRKRSATSRCLRAMRWI